MYKFFKFVFVFLFVTACQSTPSDFHEKHNSPLRLSLNITSKNVSSLKNIEAEFMVTNISNNEITYSFSSSCQYGYSIKNATNVIFNSQSTIGCLDVITKLKLEPKESKVYPISLQSAAGNNPLKKGIYKLKAFLLNSESPKTDASFVVE